MKWGGIIAGALGGLGNAGSKLADKYIEEEHTLNLERERAEILNARTMALERFRSKLQREDNEYAWEQEQERAPVKTQMELDRKQAQLEWESGSVGQRANNARTMAQATRFEDPSTREINKLQLQEAQDARKNAERLNAAREALLTARQSGNPNEIAKAKSHFDDVVAIYGKQQDWVSRDTLFKENSAQLVALYKLLAETRSKEEKATIARRIAALDAKQKELSHGHHGSASADKVATLADIQAFAKEKGRTEQEVVAHFTNHGGRIINDSGPDQPAPDTAAQPPDVSGSEALAAARDQADLEARKSQDSTVQSEEDPGVWGRTPRELADSLAAQSARDQLDWAAGEQARIANTKAAKAENRINLLISQARKGSKIALAKLKELALEGNEKARREVKRLAAKAEQDQQAWGK
jgi:hypothetical protein